MGEGAHAGSVSGVALCILSDIGQDYGEEGVLKFLRLFDEKHCKYYLARVS